MCLNCLNYRADFPGILSILDHCSFGKEERKKRRGKGGKEEGREEGRKGGSKRGRKGEREGGWQQAHLYIFKG